VEANECRISGRERYFFLYGHVALRREETTVGMVTFASSRLWRKNDDLTLRLTIRTRVRISVQAAGSASSIAFFSIPLASHTSIVPSFSV